MAERFIQKAIKRPGALRRKLGMKEGDRIPAALMEKIMAAETGEKVKIGGGKSLTVTTQTKRQAALARTLKKIRSR